MQSKKGSFLLYLIPPLFLLLIVSGLVFWQWQSAGRQGLPEVSVTLDGTALQQRGGSWDVPVLGGLLTRHLEGSYPAIGTVLPVEQPQPALAVSPEDAAITGVRLRDTADQSVLYDGDAEGFAGFSFAEDGDYFLEVTLSLDRGTQGAGTFSFDATLEVRLPRPDPSFALSSSAPQQGDLIAVTASNLPDGAVPTGESALGYVRFSPDKTPGSYTALVPVGYDRAAGEYTIEVTAGNETVSLPVTVSAAEFEVQQMTISEEISDQTVNSQAANWEFHITVVPLYDTANDELYTGGAFLQPVEGRISTPYGVLRYVNGSTTPERHGGIDIAAALGTPVLCPADGVIEYAGFLQLSGNTIVLEHGGGLKSYFYHMDSLDVATGDRVTQGSKLGEVGTTGYSTGPHLHYEVKIGRESVSPWPLFDGSSSIFAAVAG